MKTTLIVLGIIGGALLLAAIIATISIVGMYNNQATLKNQYEAKVSANTAVFDNVWKKISQTAQVTDAQKNALKEIFEGYAKARTGNDNGGQIMKWTQESIPNVDVSVYKQLMNIITGARDEWTANQIALVDISREYNQNLSTFPGNFILKICGFEKIVPKVITSSKTEKVFETGHDDDVSLNIK